MFGLLSKGHPIHVSFYMYGVCCFSILLLIFGALPSVKSEEFGLNTTFGFNKEFPFQTLDSYRGYIRTYFHFVQNTSDNADQKRYEGFVQLFNVSSMIEKKLVTYRNNSKNSEYMFLASFKLENIPNGSMKIINSKIPSYITGINVYFEIFSDFSLYYRVFPFLIILLLPLIYRKTLLLTIALFLFLSFSPLIIKLQSFSYRVYFCLSIISIALNMYDSKNPTVFSQIFLFGSFSVFVLVVGSYLLYGEFSELQIPDSVVYILFSVSIMQSIIMFSEKKSNRLLPLVGTASALLLLPVVIGPFISLHHEKVEVPMHTKFFASVLNFYSLLSLAMISYFQEVDYEQPSEDVIGILVGEMSDSDSGIEYQGLEIKNYKKVSYKALITLSVPFFIILCLMFVEKSNVYFRIEQ